MRCSSGRNAAYELGNVSALCVMANAAAVAHSALLTLCSPLMHKSSTEPKRTTDVSLGTDAVVAALVAVVAALVAEASAVTSEAVGAVAEASSSQVETSSQEENRNLFQLVGCLRAFAQAGF